MELTLSGDLTINRISDIREEILNGLNSGEKISIQIENAIAVDASMLQLLCSAHRSAVGMNKRLELTWSNSPQFAQQLKDAGFVRHTGCIFDCNQSCIWVNSDDR